MEDWKPGLVPQNVLTFCCFLILISNFPLLALQKSKQKSADRVHYVMPNGDTVKRCDTKPLDDRCVEVTDTYGRVIYKSDREKRTLGFSQCSKTAAETMDTKCVGEYAFAFDGNIYWYHRLYYNRTESEYSIVAGPEEAGIAEPVARVRHILREPFNWIISYEPLPRNVHKNTKIYIDGEVTVRELAIAA